jgi:hypothetical protein
MKIIIISLTLVLFALPVFAVTYTWEDEQGTVNFSEDLGNVPAKYRKKVKIIGEEDLLPAESDEAVGNPPEKASVKGAGGEQEKAAPATQSNDKAVYDGKDAATWKAEYAALDADVKAAEKQLVEFRNQLKDTSGMSRTEYLSIQATMHSLENSVLLRRKKLEDLKQQADAAGVPAGLMQ